ncbi:MAG: hypothetical protein ACM31C_01425 [Acidobacteriota bacterium]
MKTTVEIADPLFEEAKRESERSGCTLRDLIELGLRKELHERRTARPFTLRDASVGDPANRGKFDDRQVHLRGYVGVPGFPATDEEMTAYIDRLERERKGER